MKVRILAFLVVFAGVGLAAGTAGAHGHGRSVNVKTHGGPVASCSDLEVTFDHRLAVTAEEQRAIPRGEKLVAAPHDNGGIEVSGWDRDEFAVTLCKAADPGQRELLAQISLAVQGGRISVRGPASKEDWTAYLIVRAPKGAVMDLEAHNGPIGLHGVSGTVSARAVNGPIEMKDCSGEIDVETRNGPIEWSGGSGKVRLRAQNGPLEVKLTGSQWNGAGLEGDTQNGPLSLRVPEGYQSAVRVDASEHSPVECRAAQCRQAVRTWENPSRIEFGKGTPLVRLSTVNGPVEIR